jgi:hypothetical protein
MGRKLRLRKITDDEAVFWCAGGVGLLREEVWADEYEKVVRYNLAFVLPHLSGVDHGRILGYDNAHEVHERHFMGRVETVEFDGYPSISKQFHREVEALRRAYMEKR